MSQYNIAIFGAGRIGGVHGGNITVHPDCKVSHVIDPFGDNAEKLAAKLEAVVATEAEALADASVDAIVIGSATNTHADLIEKGLKAGKAVFCEKPVDLSLARVEQLIEAIKGESKPLFIAFNRRFDPGIWAMHERIEAGAIGDVELATIISKDPEAPPLEYIQVAGGLLRDMTIHDFDMARFLLPEEPVRVTALASALTSDVVKSEGDLDTAVITLQTASGAIATITNSRRTTYGYDQRVEVHGSGGMLRTENMQPTRLIEENASGSVHEKPLYFFIERYQESYRNEWAHFVRVLKGEEQPICTIEDGRLALVLAEAAYKSLAEGRTVDVSEI
ncbi:inositol 2-dehydrogenase [Pseudahrensia aquimaris]|uniref:Inositol 2-dehydrogenase n=1 Tax=Pseudahrensia aquimaris TaxID=744461 RepID=A0ABW3FCA4_9HYPH